MSRAILSQSLFQTTSVGDPWRSYVLSGSVHATLILAGILVSVPLMRNNIEHRRVERATLIAPNLPVYRRAPAAIQPPRLMKRSRMVAPAAAPVFKTAELRPPEIRPRPITAAPEVKSIPFPAPAPTIPEVPPNLPVPKREVRTGTFQTVETIQTPQNSRGVQVGGFGDPRGATPLEGSPSSPASLPKIGAFDLAEGTGHSGAGPRGRSGGIQTGGFGDSFGGATPAKEVSPPKPVKLAFTPVEILSKPKPAYTEEARSLKVEGQVSLEVVFESKGSVRILRIVHGLGHGLDEAAEQAAMHVQFRPATRGGVPVDSGATIRITFQLT